MAGLKRQQRRVCFEGHVQGVGFRYTTARLAGEHDVVGFVRNLDDGRVERVAEGDAGEIDSLLQGIRNHFGRNIRNEQTGTLPATGQFPAFDVRY